MFRIGSFAEMTENEVVVGESRDIYYGNMPTLKSADARRDSSSAASI
jgi:hypothetical protein